LDQIAKGLSDLGTGYSGAYSALDEAIKSIPDEEISEYSLQALMIEHPQDATINQLIQTYAAARKVKGTYQATAPAFAAVNTNLSTLSGNISEISGSLYLISGQLSSGFEETDLTSSITQLSAGIALLSDNYQSFHEGLTAYTGGVSKLASSYSRLNSGIADLSDGTEKLDTGMKELVKGSSELEKQTDNMPEQIETAVDEILADYDTSDFIPESFTSEENTVTSVQFVLQTEQIKKPELQEEVVVQNDNKNIWTRLKELFYQ
jgi:X-X-X-Leu-X-X-Gly heptad repeat protein